MSDGEHGEREAPGDGSDVLAVGLDARRPGLILIEIDDFVRLRRTIGSARSGLLTAIVADRIAATHPHLTVSPIGRTGIEVETGPTSAAALDTIVAEIHRCVEQSFVVEGQSVHLRLRIGAATGAVDDVARVEVAEQILARSRPGGDPGESVVPTAAANANDVAIGHRLLQAIDRGELFMQYQPKLHLRRQAITSVEALIRWNDPAGGLVLPDDFIPAAERSGAIRAMTLWTLRQVIGDQRLMRAAGHDLPVFVNIAGILLSDADFIDEAAKLIVKSDVSLGFEITETSVIREPATAIMHLRRMAEIGVAITIDDYGAGLSSLAYLKQLPARELKIDKLFVTQLASSHRDPLIVRSTIDLAHALDMEVVAEGVETPTSLALLSVMGCDMVQGYLISRPLVLDHLLSFLRNETHRDVLERSRSPLERLAAVQKRA